MSRRTRALAVGAILAAMQLAGMTAVAHAQANNEGKDARRPPTQGQVGEAWHQPQVAPSEPNVAGETRRPPTQSQVGESWRHQTSVPGRPAEPGGQPGWRIASLGLLAAALALVGGLAVMARHPAQPRTQGRAGALSTVTPLDGAATPTRQPHHLAGDGSFAYLASGPRQRIRRPVRARLLERIPSPLTLTSDLGKRRSAQR